MSDFSIAIGPLLLREGSAFLVNDNGRGACKYGITLKTALELYPNCTAEDIGRMTPDSAAQFYRLAFWDRYRVERINDQRLAEKIFDLAVNLGGGTAIRMLQEVVGVVRDGILGPATAAAVNCMEPGEVLGALRIAAREHYQALAAKDPAKYGDDLAGWLKRLQG